jgi:hypothetical protein
MLILKRSSPSKHTSIRPSSLEAWRAAARLVWARWETLLKAPPEMRVSAFAAYLAALDAEGAAAADMARRRPIQAR